VPRAVSDASVSSTYCLSLHDATRIGAVKRACFKSRNAFLQSGVQLKTAPFFIRLGNGRTLAAKSLTDAEEESPTVALLWAEIVERVEAARAATVPVASSSESPATALPISDTRRVERRTIVTPIAPADMHSVLRDSDIIHAVQLARAGQAEIVTDSLRAAYRTEYSRDDLLSRVRLLFGLRRNVELFMRERILQAFLSEQSLPGFIPEITGLFDHFGGDQQDQ